MTWATSIDYYYGGFYYGEKSIDRLIIQNRCGFKTIKNINDLMKELFYCIYLEDM